MPPDRDDLAHRTFVPTPMRTGTFSSDLAASRTFSGNAGSSTFRRALPEPGGTLRLTGRHAYVGHGLHVAEYDDEAGALHWRSHLGAAAAAPPQRTVRTGQVRFTDGTVRGGEER